MKLCQLTYNPFMYPILSPKITFFMAKFLIVLFVMYVIYYAGNIIYDLFFKKVNEIIKDESEFFALAEVEEQNRSAVVSVGIEDVENLNTPKSFNRKEFPIDTPFSEERADMEVWRKRFESEQNIDSFNSNDLDENNFNQQFQFETNGNFENEISTEEIDASQTNDEKWYKLLNLAETTVQLISNNNGHKVYQASSI